ncbi:MAG: hypothetical protein KF830_06620 [Planctomycetes bacterium]|nr:hypothetical protein [Planctomycetota bacterium]
MTGARPPVPVWRCRAVWTVVAATALWRVALAARTPLPSEDGVSYLWMAQRLADGEFAAGLAEVFPPGLSLLLAPWLRLGGDPVATAQAFGIACAAATVLPLAAIARRLAPDGWLAAVWLWPFGSLLARNAVEVFSEPPFLLAMALGTAAGLRGRWVLVGVAAGAAFWIRPEGLLLTAAFAAAHRRAALPALAPTVAGPALLALARWSAGHGFDPLPLLAFHDLRDDLPQRGAVVANLLQVPGAWLEAFGLAGLLGLAAWRRRREPVVQALGGFCLLQIAVVCTFVVRRRFFLSAAVPVHALAAEALAALAPRWRIGVVAGLAAIGAATGWRGTIDAGKAAEREVGRWLASQLRAEQTLVGDLARVCWYAGRQPPPPRRLPPADLLASAAPAAVRFVVLGDRRPGFGELERGLAPGFDRASLPDELAALAAARGIAVFVRR